MLIDQKKKLLYTYIISNTLRMQHKGFYVIQIPQPMWMSQMWPHPHWLQVSK